MCSICTRRVFLKAGGLSLVALGAGSLGGGPLFLHRAALAAAPPAPSQRRKVLVALFQRGAMDGLMAVPPLDEEATLRRFRPRLAMSAARVAPEGERLLELAGGFALHPALAPLAPLFHEGRCAVVHGVGSPAATRSHFDAQDYMESATPGRKGTSSGWLNRVAGELGHEASPFRAVALTPALPRSLAGEEPALAVTDLGSFALRLHGAPGVAAAGEGLAALYAHSSRQLLRETGRDTFAAVELLRQAGAGTYRPAPGARYPRSPLGAALQQVAFLIKADLGLEIAFAESGGWDTHVQQGAATGPFARRAADLAAAVAAFWTDLGSYQDEVVLLTMTEFGRTVHENGSGGTDHGHGSCLFLLGNRVAGGRVYGRLPPLGEGLLHEGRDLPVTTDFRAVFAEVAAAHLGVRDLHRVFPGWQGTRQPLFRA